MKQLIHTVFEQQALASPDAVAVKHGSATLTYAQLQRQVNQLATACLQLEPSTRGAVMVLLPKHLAIAAAMLGIFKAGKLYLPVSWQLGETTWQKIAAEIKPQIVITLASELPRLAAHFHALGLEVPQHVLLVDHSEEVAYYTYQDQQYTPQPLLFAPQEQPQVEIAPNDPCYLFFSSGTTGTPKIIEGIQKSLSHFIHWIIQEFSYDATYKVSQLAALTFDASLRDILAPLVVGGTLCIPPADITSNIHKLLQWLEEEEITAMCTVPSVFRAMVHELEQAGKGTFTFPALKHCLLAGETLYNKDIYRWKKATGAATELVNLYGTTESTMLKSFHRIGFTSGKMSDSISIGKPIANTAIFLLDEQGEICPTDEEGDVYIKTPFLTKGYYKDKIATEKIFVTNPLTGNVTDVVYKTGDTGRYGENGEIFLIGRKDAQIKLRGVRINLAGIEKAILQIAYIKQAKCLLKQNSSGDDSLICYYEAASESHQDEIKAFCQKHLNAYEVPEHFICVARFPINGHGKIDAKALPDPFRADTPSPKQPAETLTATQLKLKEVWQQLFNQNDIHIEDNFFKIGGNSLKAIQMGGILMRTMQIDLGINGLQKLFQTPTLAKFADYLDTLPRATEKLITQIQPAPLQPAYPLSFAQQQIWMACQAQSGSEAYNMPQAFRIKGKLSVALLKQSFYAVVARHEILRTAFYEQNGEVTQRVHAMEGLEPLFRFEDLRAVPNQSEKTRELITASSDTAFDLTQPTLLRLLLLQQSDEEYTLGFCMHHIVGDSWSGQLFITEIVACYQHFTNNKSWKPTPLAINYKDYAVDEQAHWQGDRFLQLEQFWAAHLGPKLPVLALPTDWPRTEQKSSEGKRCEFEVPQPLLAKLTSLAADNSMSLFGLFLSAYYLMLNQYSTDEEIIVGIPVATRNRPELTNQIGLYVNTIALKATINPAASLQDFLTSVKQALAAGYAHQAYPFQEVVKHYAHARQAKHNPVFDVAINMLTSAQSTGMSAAAGLQVEDWDRTHTQSKFDLTLYVYDDLTKAAKPFIEYKTALFKESTIQRFSERFLNLLSKFTGPLDQPLKAVLSEKAKLPSLKAATRRVLVAEA